MNLEMRFNNGQEYFGGSCRRPLRIPAKNPDAPDSKTVSWAKVPLSASAFISSYSQCYVVEVIEYLLLTMNESKEQYEGGKKVENELDGSGTLGSCRMVAQAGERIPLRQINAVVIRVQ